MSFQEQFKGASMNGVGYSACGRSRDLNDTHLPYSPNMPVGREERGDICNPCFPANLKMIDSHTLNCDIKIHLNNTGFWGGMCRMIIRWVIIKSFLISFIIYSLTHYVHQLYFDEHMIATGQIYSQVERQLSI